MHHATIAKLLLVLAFTPAGLFAQMARGQATLATRSSLQQQPAQAQPLPPLAWAEMSPVAPKVTCAGGLVTVSALNATLASVLHAVARCTGASVDMPASVGVTRVAVRLGPTQPRSILASLLDGSLDYILVGSDQNPEAVRMVMVRPRRALAAGQGQPVAASPAPADTFIDDEGVERLPSGLTPAEALLSPEELAQKFESAREQQRRSEGLPPQPNPLHP